MTSQHLRTILPIVTLSFSLGIAVPSPPAAALVPIDTAAPQPIESNLIGQNVSLDS